MLNEEGQKANHFLCLSHIHSTMNSLIATFSKNSQPDGIFLISQSYD